MNQVTENLISSLVIASIVFLIIVLPYFSYKKRIKNASEQENDSTEEIIDEVIEDQASISSNEDKNIGSSKFCSKCGIERTGGDKFCPNCGVKIVKDSTYETANKKGIVILVVLLTISITFIIYFSTLSGSELRNQAETYAHGYKIDNPGLQVEISQINMVDDNKARG